MHIYIYTVCVYIYSHQPADVVLKSWFIYIYIYLYWISSCAANAQYAQAFPSKPCPHVLICFACKHI